MGWSQSQAARNNIATLIKADYLIKDKSLYISNENAFIFLLIDKIDKKNNTLYITPTEIINVVPSSFFNSMKDYSALQKRYTLLYKEKIDLNTNQKEILYKHHNFFLDTNENVSVEVAKEAPSEQQPTAPAKKSIYAMAMENQKAKK